MRSFLTENLYKNVSYRYALHIMKQQNNVTYVFSHSTLLDALNEWQSEQIERFPHQKKRIQTTVVAMQHFLRSQQVKDHKMIMSGDPENFDIDLPKTDKSKKPK